MAILSRRAVSWYSEYQRSRSSSTASLGDRHALLLGQPHVVPGLGLHGRQDVVQGTAMSTMTVLAGCMSLALLRTAAGPAATPWRHFAVLCPGQIEPEKEGVREEMAAAGRSARPARSSPRGRAGIVCRSEGNVGDRETAAPVSA